MGLGFSCLQRDTTRFDETSTSIGATKCNHSIPPPPPRKKRGIPPPPPRTRRKVIVTETKNIKKQTQTKRNVPKPRKKRPNKSNNAHCNTLNVPSNAARPMRHRRKSMSDSEHSLTASYISTLSVLSPAGSVISALSKAPSPFVSHASNASNSSEVDSSSESSISLIRADNETTASSLHSVTDGYALASQNDAPSTEAIPSWTPTNMMQYVIQIQNQHKYNKPNKSPKIPPTSPSTTISDSLFNSQYDATEDESQYDATEDIQDTESDASDAGDCHECHECSTTHHTKYYNHEEAEEEDESTYQNEDSTHSSSCTIEHEDDTFISTICTSQQATGYTLKAPNSVISTVSALSRHSDPDGARPTIFQNHYSMASQLSELSELSVEKRNNNNNNNVVTPTMEPLSPRQCYIAVKSTSVTPHAARNMSIGPLGDDYHIGYSGIGGKVTKVPDIARFLRDAQYYHDMDAVDNLEYVD